nr:hypothetical protein GCM10020063_003650 [Dactylosporangium thailandense]
MLQRGADAAALQARDPLGGEHAGEDRVLGEVLEVAPAERGALEVDAGAARLVRARQRTVLDSLTALAEPVAEHPEALAHQIMATMDGLQLQWLRDPDGTDLVAMWTAAAEVLFAGLPV